jgi:hypothetical protein
MITKKEAVTISNLIADMNSARRISDDFRTDKEANNIMHKDSSTQQRLEWEYWVKSLELELQLLKEFGISEHSSEKAAEKITELEHYIQSGKTHLRYQEAA